MVVLGMSMDGAIVYFIEKKNIFFLKIDKKIKLL